MTEKRVIIAAGGTGGHLYPAQALAKQLFNTESDIDILFVGGGINENRHFDRSLFSGQNVSCGSFSKNKPFKSIQSVGLILQGIWQSRQIMRTFAPDLIVGFGSYHTLPPLLAAKLVGIPIVLHEANSIPGKVNRLLSKYAVATGIHFPETAQRLSGKTVEVGMPLRDGYQKEAHLIAEAYAYFQLDPLKPTILVFGGSQGASVINRIFSEAAIKLVHENDRSEPFQILHFTGDPLLSQTIQQQYKKADISACVKDFESRMDLAWSAANLVISRAGAGTIAEAMEFEVPAILIPYPYASNHQEYNADFMVNTAKGAIKIIEKELNSTTLATVIQKLFTCQAKELKKMHHHIKLYKNNRIFGDLCSLVRGYLQ